MTDDRQGASSASLTQVMGVAQSVQTPGDLGRNSAYRPRSRNEPSTEWPARWQCSLCAEPACRVVEVVAERAQLVDHRARALQRERLEVVDGDQVVLLQRIGAPSESFVGPCQVEPGGPQRGVQAQAGAQRVRRFLDVAVRVAR